MAHISNFSEFIREGFNSPPPMSNPNTSGGYQRELAKKVTQRSIANSPKNRKPLPNETDDIEQLKNQIEQKKADTIQTKDEIEKMQIDSFEEPNKAAVIQKIDQYKVKAEEIDKLSKDFDTSINTIKKNNNISSNRPVKQNTRSQMQGARRKNL